MFGFFLGKWLDKDYLFGFGFLVFKGFSDLSVSFRLIDNTKIALIRKVYKSKTTLLLGFSIYFKKRDCPMQFFVFLRYLFIWQGIEGYRISLRYAACLIIL